ncbi:MAG: RidA family protein [Propionibacteriaceae bacterium]
MTTVTERLAELGITLPQVVAPVASYVPAVRSGAFVFSSGQLPFVDGVLPATGKVGAEVDVETAQRLAGYCAVNALAAIGSVVDLDDIVQVVRVMVYVASATDFTAQAQVGNGASDQMRQIFGPAGEHARSAVGVAVLPLDTPVEVEVMVEVGSR